MPVFGTRNLQGFEFYENVGKNCRILFYRAEEPTAVSGNLRRQIAFRIVAQPGRQVTVQVGLQPLGMSHEPAASHFGILADEVLEAAGSTMGAVAAIFVIGL